MKTELQLEKEQEVQKELQTLRGALQDGNDEIIQLTLKVSSLSGIVAEQSKKIEDLTAERDSLILKLKDSESSKDLWYTHYNSVKETNTAVEKLLESVLMLLHNKNQHT